MKSRHMLLITFFSSILLYGEVQSPLDAPTVSSIVEKEKETQTVTKAKDKSVEKDKNKQKTAYDLKNI